MGVIYAYRKKDNKKIVYVGQTTDLYTRNKQHINYDPFNSNTKEYNYPLSRGIRKYGQDYYELIILEKDVLSSKLNEREKYWIAYYDTYWHGYNQTPGGSNPTKPIYEEDVINLTISLLQDENFSFKDIQNKTGLSLTHIYNINIGARRKKDNINYPIRPSNAKGTKGLKFDENELLEIYKNLIYSKKTYKKIANDFNCCPETISRINSGKIKKYKLSNYFYPLRDKNNLIKNKQINLYRLS